MTIDALIKKLEKIKEKRGNIEVEVRNNLGYFTCINTIKFKDISYLNNNVVRLDGVRNIDFEKLKRNMNKNKGDD